MTSAQPLPRAQLVGAYAVIFISQRRQQAEQAEHASYGTTADRMVTLAASQPGYLGVESVRGGDGLGITVSYWQTLADISHWRAEAEHSLARQHGRECWYESYELQIAKIERAYGWQAGAPEPATGTASA